MPSATSSAPGRAGDGQTRAAVRDRAGQRRVRLFADPQRDRPGAADAAARRSRREAGAAGGAGARQVAGVSRLVARRPADARSPRDSRAVAGRRRGRSPMSCWCRWRPSTGRATASVMAPGITTTRWSTCARPRPSSPSDGVWGAGNKGRSGPAARRGAGLCANGKESVRFPELENCVSCFIGDVVGKTGRTAISEHLPGMVKRLVARSRRHQRRECRRRFRDHRGDLSGFSRCRRRRGHARQPRLESEGGAGFHRARAASDPAAEFSAPHAGPRRRPGRHQERQACAGHQCHGPRLHGAAQRSLQRSRQGARRLSAARGGGCHRGRFPRRGDQRKAGHGLLLRRPREPRRRHPYACADRRSSDPVRRHRLYERCRHDRRL